MIEKILTDYWAHVTLILLAISYFIKRIFDNKSKKIEINHSLFQQNRLNVVNSFFSNYTKAELMWEQLAIYEILSKKLDVKAIDNIIWPILNELKKNQIELQVYFNDRDIISFNKVIDNLYSVNKKLSELYFDYDIKKTVATKSSDFFLFRVKINEENTKIIKDICVIVKNTFAS
jgi:hypothetical protein